MKKTPQQLEWILAEAERVNAVLVNDYTSLKEKVKNLTGEVATLQKQNKIFDDSTRDLKAADLSQKEDIDRLNLIIEFEREQRFDWEQKNDMLILQMNNTKITLMGTEDKVKQQQETIRQQLESLQGKDDLIEQHTRKIGTLEEGLKGLKTTFDDTYRQYHEGKVRLEMVENEREQYLQKLSTSKQEIAQARETISEMETRLSEHHKLLEMEQIHRCNLETQMDDLQKHNRRLVQQAAEVTAKDKASEKTVDELKMQIEQLERVRDHFTSLLDKEKSSKAPSVEQSPAEEERKLKSSQEHNLTVQSLRLEVEEKNKCIASLETHVASLEQKYSQLETEKADMVYETNQLVQKLSDEINELKAERDAKQDSGSRLEKERELHNKIKAMDDALQEQREKVRAAEDSIIELIKKHRNDLEQLQIGTENGNGTEEHDKSPSSTNRMDLVEQKLKQHLEDEKVQLERLTSTLEENRERHKQELYKFNLERTNLVEELQRVEELRRDLEARDLAVTQRREQLQELEEQIEEMASQKEEIAVAERRLLADAQQFDQLKATVNAEMEVIEVAKKEVEEAKSKLAEEKLQSEQQTKMLAADREQIEAEKKTLAEEKADIDNEMMRLVEQRLEMQQMKQEFEDKETRFQITIKEKDAKLEELSHSIAEERKQKEKLESKFAAGQKTPDAKDGFTFSYFKNRTANKEKEKENENTPPADGTPPLNASSAVDNNLLPLPLTDEERKLKLFNEYQVLLTEINTSLFQKREQVSDIEKTGGGSILKKMGLSSLKSSITKLEDLQARVKKGFRALDDRPTCTPTDETSEHAVLKAFRNEIN